MRQYTFNTILLFLFTCSLSSQNLTLENEVNIFSFKTEKGKIASLSMEKDSLYIIYRFGTEEKVELEFPEKNKQSWKKFKFNSYNRGGGKENAGMEIYNIMFKNNGFQYVLFTSYYAEDDSNEIGIHVINLKNNKDVRIKGEIETQNGSLYEFKYTNLLEFEDFGLFN